MKVVVQNGATHGFSRKSLEAIIPLFPEAWSRHVAKIVLYQCEGASLAFKYFAQQRTLGVFWPASTGGPVQVATATKELLVAFAVIASTGTCPAKVSKALRAQASAQVAELVIKANHVLAQGDA
jgi:trans-2-enoyl-CoA reductase